MIANGRPAAHITPGQAFFFAVALAVALAAVLIPVLPGETPLESGDAAYKTFEVSGQVIVREGEVVNQTQLDQIKGAGLLDNELGLDDALAASLIALVAGVGCRAVPVSLPTG